MSEASAASFAPRSHISNVLSGSVTKPPKPAQHDEPAEFSTTLSKEGPNRLLAGLSWLATAADRAVCNALFAEEQAQKQKQKNSRARRKTDPPAKPTPSKASTAKPAVTEDSPGRDAQPTQALSPGSAVPRLNLGALNSSTTAPMPASAPSSPDKATVQSANGTASMGLVLQAAPRGVSVEEPAESPALEPAPRGVSADRETPSSQSPQPLQPRAHPDKINLAHKMPTHGSLVRASGFSSGLSEQFTEEFAERANSTNSVELQKGEVLSLKPAPRPQRDVVSAPIIAAGDTALDIDDLEIDDCEDAFDDAPAAVKTLLTPRHGVSTPERLHTPVASPRDVDLAAESASSAAVVDAEGKIASRETTASAEASNVVRETSSSILSQALELQRLADEAGGADTPATADAKVIVPQAPEDILQQALELQRLAEVPAASPTADNSAETQSSALGSTSEPSPKEAAAPATTGANVADSVAAESAADSKSAVEDCVKPGVPCEATSADTAEVASAEVPEANSAPSPAGAATEVDLDQIEQVDSALQDLSVAEDAPASTGASADLDADAAASSPSKARAAPTKDWRYFAQQRLQGKEETPK